MRGNGGVTPLRDRETGELLGYAFTWHVTRSVACVTLVHPDGQRARPADFL